MFRRGLARPVLTTISFLLLSQTASFPSPQNDQADIPVRRHRLRVADITGTGRLEALFLDKQGEQDLRDGHPDRAADAYRRAVSLKIRHFGRSHPEVARSLIGLANAEFALGKFEEALRAQKKALRIRREKLGPDHWLVASVYNDIAATLEASGRFDEAAKMMRKDIHIHEKRLGSGHVRLGGMWLRYAKLLKKAGRLDDAERAENRGHEIYAAAHRGGPDDSPPRPSLPPEIKRISVPGVTAHYGGERPDNAPLRFGVTALWFTFSNDKETYRFKPEVGLSFWEWNLEIFSPDGKRVALLQDRYGPYHIVRTDRLKDYLRGRALPDETVGRKPKAGEISSIHEDAAWLSNDQFRYTLVCCGERTVKVHRLQAGENQ